ncbi:MAG TPA: hypothetical protein VE442_20860 [Jatrophihabitans sp.]|jgi:hypothetical protein|nr:hypothetical protein [Jatrophihabitans sp.]
MLAGAMALLGVVVGAALCLAANLVTDRQRERRDAGQRAAETKQACYRRTLDALDQILAMRSDHPDLGLAVRGVTADITELRLTAPPLVAELADMCAQAALQPDRNPLYASQLRARFVDLVRADLLEETAHSARISVSWPRSTPSRHARHAKPQRA